MKINKIEDYYDMDIYYIFNISLFDIENKYILLAKEIDKNNYSEDCFGICIYYDKYGKFKIASGLSENEQLYYIDDNGNTNWMNYRVNYDLYNQIVKICIQEVMNE